MPGGLLLSDSERNAREGAYIAGSVLEARLERPSFFASLWMDNRHDLAAGSCRRTSVIWVTSPVLGLLDDRGLLTHFGLMRSRLTTQRGASHLRMR
jgi:hypothetical protein